MQIQLITLLAHYRKRYHNKLYPTTFRLNDDPKEIWVNCGQDEKTSANMTSKIRADPKFNELIKDNHAAGALIRCLNYKRELVWRLRIRW